MKKGLLPMSPKKEEKRPEKKGLKEFIRGMKIGAKGGMDQFLFHRLEIIFGFLMLAGVVLSFFFIHLGGAFVGLSLGLCFYRKILSWLSAVSDLYNTEGLFKTIMILSGILYLLISVPVFLVSSIVGFVTMALFSKAFKHH